MVRGIGRLDVNDMHMKEMQTVYKHLRDVAGNAAKLEIRIKLKPARHQYEPSTQITQEKT
jgi:hypothetical protein